MTTDSSILAWRIPWTEEPGRLQSMGWQRIDMTEPLTHEDRKPEITQRGLCRGERGGAGPQSRRCPCVGLSRLWAQQRQRGLHRSLRSSQHALGGVTLGGGHNRRDFSVGTNQRGPVPPRVQKVSGERACHSASAVRGEWDKQKLVIWGRLGTGS